MGLDIMGNTKKSQESLEAKPADGIIGWLDTPIGKVPRVSTALNPADRIGSWRARWAIGMMHYTVAPGLYALGYPGPWSEVLVTANYKLSFDRLRSQMGGRDAWLLILDTKGINVWCAAGKGTFGTEELAQRIKITKLADIISHKRIILPQLSAPGVAAHLLRQHTGFKVIYGPVRAADIPCFLDNNLKVTPDMRRVNFPFLDRVVLTPMELVMALKPAGIMLVIFFVLGGIEKSGFTLTGMLANASFSFTLIASGLLFGAVVTPASLPWIPGRPLALKGAFVGLAGAALLNKFLGIYLFGTMGIASFFLVTACSSFLAMNFTGATTYTSLSGVKREMAFAVPAQVLSLIIGLGFLIKSYLS